MQKYILFFNVCCICISQLNGLLRDWPVLGTKCCEKCFRSIRYIVWECHKHLQFLSTLMNQVGASCRLCVSHITVSHAIILLTLCFHCHQIFLLYSLLRSFIPALSCVCVFYSVFISIKATITSMFTTHQL